jgi:Na+/H+-dicarboxylate symporter
MQGFAPFKSLDAFIVAVLLALALQACYYLTRVKLGSWVHLLKLLAGGSDAFLTPFSTSYCAAAMPITFEVLEKKLV